MRTRLKAEQERLQALEEYYDIRQLELSAAHNNMKNTLLLKIDMEQLLYERNQIFKRKTGSWSVVLK